jgi:hypothetical protein
VLRLLNDVGDRQDELPLVQHVLMRTWDHWSHDKVSGRPIDLEDYEAVGGLQNALSMHAEEAYQETGSEDMKRLTERMFRALTDTFTDPRGVRRPTSVGDLAAICQAPESDVIAIVEIFRRPGRTFLTPPAVVPLTANVVVDLSHESLMRCWTRLIAWAQQERISTSIYSRLAREATWYGEGAAGLWDDPELSSARWRRENRPTAAWARRYGDTFERHAVPRSRAAARSIRAEKAWRVCDGWCSRGRRLSSALPRHRMAARLAPQGPGGEESGPGDGSRRTVMVATDRNQKAWAPTCRRWSSSGASCSNARSVYAEFIAQQQRSSSPRWASPFPARRDQPHARLAAGREKEYRAAIALFDDLVRDRPQNADHRQALATAYNSLGELLRPSLSRRDEAEKA